MLITTVYEDVSDRELERLMQENIAAKWFCNFQLAENTPNYSVFSRIRKKSAPIYYLKYLLIYVIN